MKKKELINNFSISRDESYSEYFRNKDLEEFRKFINERTYTVGKIDISYRMINSWDNNGILPDGAKTISGWRKFSFVELVWLKSLVSFRKFGLSLDKIANIKKSIMSWDKENDVYALLEFYIYKAWHTTDDPYIIVLENGNAEIGTTKEIEMAKFWHKSNNMLLISLKSILLGVGIKVNFIKLLLANSDTEEELLSIIRSGHSKIETKKLVGKKLEHANLLNRIIENEPVIEEIKIKPRNQKIEQLEITEGYHSNPPIKKIMDETKSGYTELIIKSQDGVRESAKLIKKKRYK